MQQTPRLALCTLMLGIFSCTFDRGGVPPKFRDTPTPDWTPGTDLRLDRTAEQTPEAGPDLPPREAGPDPWFDSAWSHRKRITVGAGLTVATLTDFPLLVSWASDADLKTSAQTKGEDLVFVLAGTTQKLAHEIEDYDEKSGRLVAWVRLPTLPAGVATEIDLYYGNASAAPQQDATQVWIAGYEAVWHLAQEPGAVVDSAGKHPGSCRGNMDKKDLVTGQVGKGLDFDGKDDAFDVPALDVVASGGGDDGLTVEGWVFSRSGSGRLISKATGLAVDKHYWMLGLSADGSNTIDFRLRTAGTVVWKQASGFSTSSWMHLAATYDGAMMRVFKDGQKVLETACTGAIDTNSSTPTSVGDQPGGSRPLDGILDEVRVSTRARGEAWIQAQFANQSDPGAHLTIGPQEP